MNVEPGCIAALLPENEWPADPWLSGITTRDVLRSWRPGEIVVVTSQIDEHAVVGSLEDRHGRRGAIVPTRCLRCVVPNKHRFDLPSYENSIRFAQWYDQMQVEVEQLRGELAIASRWRLG